MFPIPSGSASSKAYRDPGGNITGLATFVPEEFSGETIEILQEMVPGASKIAVLANPGNQMHKKVIAEELPSTARNLGVTLLIVEATTAEEIDIAFASAATQHADAIVVFGDHLTIRRPTIIALAAKHRLPANYLLPTIRQQWGIDLIRPRFSRFVSSCRRLRR